MSKKRARLVLVSMFVAWLIVGVRLFWLAVWSVPPGVKDGFASQPKIEFGARGNIYDRNGAPLVMNEKIYELYIDCQVAPSGESAERLIYERLKSYLGESKKLSFSDIAKALSSGSRYYKLGIELTPEEAAVVMSAKIRGIGAEPKIRRVYPEGTLARAILGFCGIGGKTGVEHAFDKYLQGKPFKQNRHRDGAGRNIPEDFYFENSVKGADIYLTIDKNIQFIAERAASDALIGTGASKVIIIVQEPNTGEILAMATKCNSKEGESPMSVPMTIAPISEVFEPGSTFKTFTYAIALAASAVKEDELIFCENGEYKVYNHTINDHEKKSWLTLRQAFAYSSNIACAKISQRFSREKMIEGLRDFGFWSRSGINLPGEEKGLFPKSNDPLTFMTVSFGQGIGVTPLQLVNGYSAIANGGWLLEPRIILKISSAKDLVNDSPAIGKNHYFSLPFNSEEKFSVKRKVIRRVISDPRVLESIKDMLGDVVSYGTGKMSSVEGYNVGGKTGTAQKRDKTTGKYSKRYYVASFCGIVPLENPRLTILVLVDSPTKGDYWGSTIAAPVFARVARETASYLRIPPSNNKDTWTAELVLNR